MLQHRVFQTAGSQTPDCGPIQGHGAFTTGPQEKDKIEQLDISEIAECDISCSNDIKRDCAAFSLLHPFHSDNILIAVGHLLS